MDRTARAAEVVIAMQADELREAEARAARAEREARQAQDEAATLRASLDTERAQRRHAEEGLLLERGRREAAEALVAREREACAQLDARLTQAIAAGAAAPAEPCEYHLDMTNRDPNGRTRVAKLVPVKKGA